MSSQSFRIPNTRPRDDRAYPSSILDWWRVLRRRRRALGGAAVTTLAAIGLMGMVQPRVYRSTCAMLMPEGVPAQSSTQRGLDLGLQQEYLQGLFADQRLIVSARANAAVRKWKASAAGTEARRDNEVQFALASLTVTAAPGGKVFYVSSDAHDPELAAAAANAAASTLIDLDTGRQRSADAAKVASLRAAQGRLRTAMAAAEDEVRTAMRAGTAISEEERTRWLNRLSQSNEDVVRAHVNRVSAQAQYEAFLNSPGSAPAEYSDREFARMTRNNLAEVRQQLSAAEALFTPDHYKVQQLQAEVKAGADAATGHDDAIADAVRDEYVVAARREQVFSREHLTTIAAAAQAWDPGLSDEAARRLEQARTLYDSLAAQLEATEAREDQPKNSIFDPAVPVNAPIRPNLVLTAPFGLVVGMLLCSVVLLMRESSQETGTGPQPLGVYARALELASIAKSPKEGGTVHRSSAAADEFRNLRESILIWENSLGDTQPRLLGRGTSLTITSPRVAAGVTAVACNLAVSLANSGRKVLLVDGNLQRPRVHESLPLFDSAPEAPVLAGTVPTPLNGAPRFTEIPGLLVLLPEKDGGSDPLTEGTAAAFLVAACARFDFVILDVPPASSTDARIWAHTCDGALLVVEAGAPAGDLSAALLCLGQSAARLAGTVVNCIDEASEGRRMNWRRPVAGGKDPWS
jgi:polysaccharide biosynthesis transport protein